MAATETPVADPATPVAPVAQVVEKYIALRDKLAEMKKQFDNDTETIKTAMARCEAFLMQTMQAQGTESLKTPAGTAYQSTKTSATVADWDATLNWIRENEHWAMLDKRVSKTFVEAFRNEHNDLPPGVNWREERSVNIRRN